VTRSRSCLTSSSAPSRRAANTLALPPKLSAYIDISNISDPDCITYVHFSRVSVAMLSGLVCQLFLRSTRKGRKEVGMTYKTTAQYDSASLRCSQTAKPRNEKPTEVSVRVDRLEPGGRSWKCLHNCCRISLSRVQVYRSQAHRALRKMQLRRGRRRSRAAGRIWNELRGIPRKTEHDKDPLMSNYCLPDSISMASCTAASTSDAK